MNNQWSLETHGDPLGKVRSVIKQVWQESNLSGMLVTVVGEEEASAAAHFAVDIESIADINPFTPLMEVNIAQLIPDMLADHPDEQIGVLLRPCEMRALIEMTKHIPLKLDHLLTISVDCLGTIPADEYQWRLERIDSTRQGEQKKPCADDDLSVEALKYARQGGIIPYRYRSACQVCASPCAEQADINFHIIGLPIRQQMLLSVRDPKIANTIHVEMLVDGVADASLVDQHERMLFNIGERHQRTMERINEGLGNLLPNDVEAVIHQLEHCGDCESCMEACPICSVEQPIRRSDGHFERISVMRWLVSCAGCGMCEQACPENLPTEAIFAHIRQQLDKEWSYVPGRSISEPLPIS